VEVLKMNSTRTLLLVSGGLSFAMAIGIACGFPDPRIVPDDQLADGDSDSGVFDPDAEVLVDGQSLDALVTNDAGGTTVDAAGCDATCDCDGDGFLWIEHTDAAACRDSGKGLGDCDDTDGRIRPNQGYLDIDPTVAPVSSRGGDWNCKDDEEHLIREDMACGSLSVANCTGQGFTAITKCGQTGNAVKCTPVAALFCRTDPIVSPKQACK
jgi:hypothetical protein